MNASPAPPLRVAVLLSGGGSTLQNLIDRDLPIEIVRVIATKAGCFGLERASAAGIPTDEIPRPVHADIGSFSEAIDASLDRAEPELIVMAGLIHKWRIPDRYEWKVINVHPALIPAFSGQGFYGGRVHRAVVESGVRLTGCTVHFADQEYDHGPIILQRVVPVRPDDDADDVQARVMAAEREALPHAIRLFAEGRVRRDGRRITID